MAIALPISSGLFIHMQDSLRNVEVKRVVLTSGFHQDLADFQWLAEDLSRRPKRLHKPVPLHTTMDIYHNVSDYMCGGGSTPRTNCGAPDPPTVA